jgi:hypothetical protein
MSEFDISRQTAPFPDEREVYEDYLALRDVFYPRWLEMHSQSYTEAGDYWAEIKELYEDDMGYSPEAFRQLGDMAFQDIRDLKLFERTRLPYIEVQRALFSATREPRE